MNDTGSDDWVWTTPPNTKERLDEIDRWMARQARAATDRLILTMRESAEEARSFAEGVRLIQAAFDEEEP